MWELELVNSQRPKNHWPENAIPLPMTTFVVEYHDHDNLLLILLLLFKTTLKQLQHVDIHGDDTNASCNKHCAGGDGQNTLEAHACRWHALITHVNA